MKGKRSAPLPLNRGTADLSRPITAFCYCLNAYVQLAGKSQRRALPTPFWDTAAALPRFCGLPFATSCLGAGPEPSCSTCHVGRNNLLAAHRGDQTQEPSQLRAFYHFINAHQCSKPPLTARTLGQKPSSQPGPVHRQKLYSPLAALKQSPIARPR